MCVFWNAIFRVELLVGDSSVYVRVCVCHVEYDQVDRAERTKQ